MIAIEFSFGMVVVVFAALLFICTIILRANTKKKLTEDDFNSLDAEKKKENFRNYADSARQERVENFYKDQHTNQNYEFVMKMRDRHLRFDKCVKDVWEMAEYLDQVVDDSDPDTDLTQLQHAVQTAEACRKAYPGEEFDWFHLAAFIHDLGKILAVDDSELRLTADPQWSIVGDTFPVGCKYSDKCVFPKYFQLNEDYLNEKYNTKYGIYEHGCGLDGVTMSWGHDEYIYYIAKHQSTLPEKALYMLRYHSLYPWHKEGAYMHFCNAKDLEMLKWVQCFNQFDLYSKNQDCPDVSEVAGYYKRIIAKYFPKPVRW